jgi:hypothetical protein
MAGRIQSVLYDIDQTQDTTSEDRELARKNIGAYEDKTTAGGIPKADLASEVQSSLVKADSSVQSVTSNGQTLTKSAAGAIDIPKATNTVWGVVQVVNELSNDQNVIPNSRVIKEAVDGLKARATFWTVQEWQTQSAQPGDPSKIYYVGPKGTGNDKYDMYEWSTKSNIYILTDESTISLDGYWHGAPDIIGEDTLAPFVTSIEKNSDDTVKYRTCSATVGNRALPVFMDSGVVTPADPHFMYPTVKKSTTFEEVEALVNAGYRPIFVPEINSYGVHTRYILTGARAEGYTPAFIFTALIPGSKYTRYFTSERMQTVICQHPNNETEETWVENDEILIPNIPEPNQMGGDVGKVLTASGNGLLYWAEPDGVTYQYVDEQIETREPRLPVHSYAEKNKVLTVSGNNGELGWMSPLPETSGSQYLIGDNGTPKWRDREKLVYRSNSLGYHIVTQEDLDAGFIVFPITTWNIPAPGIAIDAFLYFLVVDKAGYTAAGEATGHPLMGVVTTFSIGYWNDDNTWCGGLLEDIAGSDLPYGSYGHGSIRRTGVTTCMDSTKDLYKMRGPAIRLKLTSSPSVGVGDKIKISGTIIGIRIDGGLW